MKNSFLYYIISLNNFFKRYQSGITFLLVVLTVLIIDLVFFNVMSYFNPSFMATPMSEKGSITIDFAPEIWLTLLSLVLGTLIIVISIASQSTPKLIDLYIHDQTSLLYVWYIAAGSVHNLYLQLFSSGEVSSYKTSTLLNTYFMLPLALLLAIPYVLYILRYTKTKNVIEKIYLDNLKRINRLPKYAKIDAFNKPKSVKEYQHNMFESLNQLDDLLEYVDFKEPKGDIINKIGLSMQEYVKVKKEITTDSFFHISPAIQTDISFKTMTSVQFKEMKETKTFFEEKGFRLLGNAFLKLIERGDFDLASLCVYELSQVGKAAMEVNDEALLNAVVVRFNTFLRFGIKHGIRNSEARNLYNAIFHYSEFIRELVHHKNTVFIKQCCTYLNIYIREIYRHSQKESAFVFLVDVFTWELQKVLIEMHKQQVDLDLQKEILNLFLLIDNLSDSNIQNPEDKLRFSAGIRVLQIALALFYLKSNAHDFVDNIIHDIVEDVENISHEKIKANIMGTCKRIEVSGSKFWEDTDRGNINLYYSNDKDILPEFIKLFEDKLQKKLSN